MTYVFLADGFEEIEALAPVDMLRRAGIKTKTVGVTGKSITGTHGITVTSDITIEDAAKLNDKIDMIVLPGGLPGADNLRESELVQEFIDRIDNEGAYIAAICAAPRILGERGMLDNKTAVCYPGFEKYLTGAKTCDKRVVCDGNIITGMGMGCAVEFGLELIRVLAGEEISEKIKTGIIG